MGVLVGKGGFYGNVFRITPPLCFTLSDSGKLHRVLFLYFQFLYILTVFFRMFDFVDFLVDVMDHAMSKM